jgi:glycosyltransferase involved in cell wall biosynthesis
VGAHLPISVIIPAYNASQTIVACLQSIVEQTNLPAETIVIDDGSCDETFEIVRSFAQSHPVFRWTILRQANEGAGAARNAGLHAAEQPLVAFLDSDDRWLPEKLTESADVLARGTDLVSTDIIAVAEDGRETFIECSRHFPKQGNPFEPLFMRGFIATSTVVAKRERLLEAGGFDPTLLAAQDYDLWLRLASDPEFTMLIVAMPLTRYAIRSGSITSHAFRRLWCGLRIMAKCYPVLRTRSGRARARVLLLKKAGLLLAEYVLNLMR